MRSNDIFIGLPHDIFCFTMLQEIVARLLYVDLGTYKHAVGSLHLYKKNNRRALKFLNEGWQSTKIDMPPMPEGDPRPNINALLVAESNIRFSSQPSNDCELKRLDPYWADLVRLLQIFRFSKDGNIKEIQNVRKSMSSPYFDSFIDKKTI